MNIKRFVSMFLSHFDVMLLAFFGVTVVSFTLHLSDGRCFTINKGADFNEEEKG